MRLRRDRSTVIPARGRTLRSLSLQMDCIEPLLQHLLGIQSYEGRHQPRDQSGPPGLVAGAYARPIVSVEVLVEQDQIAPVRVVLELPAPTVHGSASLSVAQEDL